MKRLDELGQQIAMITDRAAQAGREACTIGRHRMVCRGCQLHAD
jgi:hypothetical protein